MPPTAGLQDICAMRSIFIVIIAVRRPMRAHARAASQPAWPAPTTTTSYRDDCMKFIFSVAYLLSCENPGGGFGRARACPVLETSAESKNDGTLCCSWKSGNGSGRDFDHKHGLRSEE